MYHKSNAVINQYPKELKENGFPVFFIHDLQKKDIIDTNSSLKDALLQCKDSSKDKKFVYTLVYKVLNSKPTADSGELSQTIIDVLKGVKILLAAGFKKKFIASLNIPFLENRNVIKAIKNCSEESGSVAFASKIFQETSQNHHLNANLTINLLNNAKIFKTAGFSEKYIHTLSGKKLANHSYFIKDNNVKLEKTTWRRRHKFTKGTTMNLLNKYGMKVKDNDISNIPTTLQRQLYLAFKDYNNEIEFKTTVVNIIDNMKISEREKIFVQNYDDRLVELHNDPLKNADGNKIAGFRDRTNIEIGEKFSAQHATTSNPSFYYEEKYWSYRDRERAINEGKNRPGYVKDQMFATVHHQPTTASIKQKLYTLCANPLAVDVSGSLKTYQLEKKDCFFYRNVERESCNQLIDIDHKITAIYEKQDQLNEDDREQIRQSLDTLYSIKKYVYNKSRLQNYATLLRQKIGAILHSDNVENNSIKYYEELK